MKQTTGWDRDNRRKTLSTNQEQDRVRKWLVAQSELQYDPNQMHKKTQTTEARQQSSPSQNTAIEKNQKSEAEEAPAIKKAQTSGEGRRRLRPIDNWAMWIDN